MKEKKTMIPTESDVLRGCLKTVLNDLQEISEFATKHDFAGDLFIVGTANNAIGKIKYVLSGGSEE